MWQVIRKLVVEIPASIKVDFADDCSKSWSSWIHFPERGYGDIAAFGPFKLNRVSAIYLNPVERVRVGRLLPERLVDRSERLKSQLNEAGVSWIAQANSVVKIPVDRDWR